MTTKTTKRNRVAAILAGTALLGVGGIATSALFTDNATVSAVANTGTLEIEVDGHATLTLDDINNTVFAPGVSASQTVEVSNAGAVLPIDAVVDFSATLGNDTDLASILTVTVTAVDESGAEVFAALPDGTPIPDTPLYEGVLEDFSITDMRLPGGETYELTFYVAMPSGAPDINLAQGKSVSITLEAQATQSPDHDG